jgi:hypothetical protein
MKISFSREEYLSVSSVFENETLDDIGSELSEFNEDVEDMAYELAYTRYALAKTERELAALKAAANLLVLTTQPVLGEDGHLWVTDHAVIELARLCGEG